jgi:hypothetical protein
MSTIKGVYQEEEEEDDKRGPLVCCSFVFVVDEWLTGFTRPVASFCGHEDRLIEPTMVPCCECQCWWQLLCSKILNNDKVCRLNSYAGILW